MRKGICVFVQGKEHREMGRKAVDVDRQSIKWRKKNYIIDWSFRMPYVDKKGRQVLFFEVDTLLPLIAFQENPRQGEYSSDFMNALSRSAGLWEEYYEKNKVANVILGSTKALKAMDRGQIITYIMLGAFIGFIVGAYAARFIH